jgi:tight adherence protein B
LLRKTATSRFDWIGQTVSKYISMQSLQKWISQAALNTTASALFVQTAAAAGIGFVITMFFAPILGVEFGVAGGCATLPWVRVAFARYRRLRAFEKALPHAIDMMARSLRAGHSTSAAIEIMAQGAPEPACSEFSEVFRQQNFGLPLRDALMQLIDRVPSPDLRVLVTAIVVQRETGGNLVEVLDRTTHVIRERQRIQGEIRTQTAQGRMTGWILTLLPVVVMGMINVMDPGYSKPLLHDPFGHKLLLLCGGLILAGGFIINRIINSIDV